MSQQINNINQCPQSMVLELAAQLRPVAEILDQFGYTQAEFERLQRSPSFQQALTEAKALWHDADNLKERLRVKAGMLVEDSILKVYAMVHNEDLPAPSRLDAFGRLAKMARVSGDEVKHEGAGEEGQKVSINITLAGNPDVKQVAQPAPRTINADAETAQEADYMEAEEEEDGVGDLPSPSEHSLKLGLKLRQGS